VRVVLGPGAFGSAASMRPYVDGLLRRGVDAVAIELPRGRAERAAPAFAPFAGQLFGGRATAIGGQLFEGRATAIGGHSFGGRAASLAAAEADFAGLVCFSFPLAGRAAERTAHFGRIRCPVLIVNGSDDPLAPGAEMRAAAAKLEAGRLVLLEGTGHGLTGHLEEALDLAAGFLLSLST
jgi:predicted alpha/beta-hydrolase family hydrolase